MVCFFFVVISATETGKNMWCQHRHFPLLISWYSCGLFMGEVMISTFEAKWWTRDFSIGDLQFCEGNKTKQKTNKKREKNKSAYLHGDIKRAGFLTIGISIESWKIHCWSEKPRHKTTKELGHTETEVFP